MLPRHNIGPPEPGRGSGGGNVAGRGGARRQFEAERAEPRPGAACAGMPCRRRVPSREAGICAGTGDGEGRCGGASSMGRAVCGAGRGGQGERGNGVRRESREGAAAREAMRRCCFSWSMEEARRVWKGAAAAVVVVDGESKGQN